MKRIIYGRNPVSELLKNTPDKITKIYFLKNLREKNFFKYVLGLAGKNKISIEETDLVFFKKNFGGFSHQGIVAYVHEFAYATLENIKWGQLPFLLLLDKIQDPQNFGSIIRTSAAFDVDGIIIPERRSVEVTPAVSKVSAGAVENIPIIKVTNLVNTIKKLKEDGFWVMGAASTGDKNFFEIDFKIPLALVLGNEGYGLSRLVKENCDTLIKIPQGEKISSLNVNIAGAIIMFEIFKQRNC